MATFRGAFKFTLLVTLTAVIIFAVTVVYFLFMAPRSGAAPDGTRLSQIEESPNYQDGKFQNTIPTVLQGHGPAVMLGAGYDWLFGGAERAPRNVLPVGFGADSLLVNDNSIVVTWFGHSTVLLEFEGRTILFDPMFSESAAPVPFLAKRFPVEREFEISSLPPLDAVVISHDHYDHLDLESVRILDAKTKRFFVPLGVGAHLESWGVDFQKIIELDWWESVGFAGLTFSATPARHFSGRSLPASNNTLWASWVVSNARMVGERKIDATKTVFFSGDSGYFPGFKEIGQRFGPFDFCMVECGQYSENWPDVHMAPEQTVRAFLDLRGDLLMPIHWSAFDLSLHDWNEPPTRMTREAEKENVRVALPMIGQRFTIDNPPQLRWWEDVD